MGKTVIITNAPPNKKKINDLKYPENEIWEKPNWSLNKAPNDFDESRNYHMIVYWKKNGKL